MKRMCTSLVAQVVEKNKIKGTQERLPGVFISCKWVIFLTTNFDSKNHDCYTIKNKKK